MSEQATKEPISSLPGQRLLFEKPPAWDEHWQGMPEFSQEDLMPHRTLYVHFTCKEDVAAFSQLVGQKIGPRTKSIWHPAAEIGHFANVRYIDAA
jgi:hypothetical protein